ncbi:MAG: NUDIX hydrolase [Blastocatellia bacterium]
METYDLVYCAGGVLWREANDGREVLLVQSRDNKDWKFPKGHVDDTDPRWDAAALREVREETGYDAAILDFAGFTKYPVGARMKVVLYWHMQPLGDFAFTESDEIEHCEWLSIPAAMARLTFDLDRDFLRRFLRDGEI